MRKIIFKLGSFPQTSETFVVNSIIETIKLGFEVEIIVNELLPFTNSSQQSLLEKYNISQKIRLFKNPLEKIKRLLTLFYTCLNPFYLYYFIKSGITKKKWTVDYIYQLKFYKKYKKNDVFHVHFGTMAEPLIFLKKIGYLKSKVIVTFHGYDAHFDENTFEIRKASYKDLFNYVDLVSTNTPYLKKQVIALGCNEDKIEVVPMPVDTAFFVPIAENSKNENRIALLSVGRLISLKGFKYGLHAIRSLIQKGYDVSYTIIGEGKEYANLEAAIKECQLEKHVSLLGKRNQIFIKEQLQKADIFLMTSVTDDGSRKEAQGVVSIEAQSCGIPLVAFNSGGVPYTLLDKKTGFLCEEKNIEEMAENIAYLIDNKKERLQMGTNAREFVLENYSNIVISKKWEYLYTTI